MTSEEIVTLVDRCCDGQINTTELERLEDALRRSPEHAKRIAEELELAGLISEALDQTDPADFLRGFRERLEAGRSGHSFSRAIVRRALTEEQQQRAPARGLRMGRVGSAVEAPVKKRSLRRSRRFWWFALPALFLGTLLLFGPLRLSSPLRITQSSPGVVVLDATSVSPGIISRRLRPGDRVEVPIGASASFEYRDGTRLELSPGAILVEPGTVPVYGEQATRHRRFFLESGTLKLSLGKAKACIVYTPQCKAECVAGSATISVTRNSTRIVALASPQPEECIVSVTRNRGGNVFRLAPGEEHVVSANEGMP